MMGEQRIRGALKTGAVRKLACFYLDRDIDYDELVAEIAAKIDRTETEPYELEQPDFVLTSDKGEGVMRKLYMFNPVDYGVYFYCLLTLDACLARYKVQNTYGMYSMGGPSRYKVPRLSRDGYMEPPSSHPETLARYAYMTDYGNFNSGLIKAISARPACNVITLDINNFYDNVRLDLLEQMVRRAVSGLNPASENVNFSTGKNTFFEPSPDVSDLIPNLDASARLDRSPEVDLLFRFLKNWNRIFNPTCAYSVGLPQDLVGDCSRMLANFYLIPYDLAFSSWLRKNSAEVFRYSDDQMIVAPKNLDPRLVVRKASEELGKYGLHLNLSKVKVFDDADEFLRWRGVPVYNVLPPNCHGMYTHNEAAANDLACAFLNANRAEIYKNASAIMKTIVSIGVNKLDPEIRREILRLVNYQYLPDLDERHMVKLLSDLSDADLREFLFALDLTLSRQVHTSQKYEAVKATEHTAYAPRFQKYLPDILG